MPCTKPARLEEAFSRTRLTSFRGSPLIDLGRHAGRVARRRPYENWPGHHRRRGRVAQLQSAVLWTCLGG